MKMTKMQQYIATDTSQLNREAQKLEVKKPKQQGFREWKVTATSQFLSLTVHYYYAPVTVLLIFIPHFLMHSSARYLQELYLFIQYQNHPSSFV